MSGVADLLRNKLEKFSDLTAIQVDGGVSLTYREVDACSSQLANHLIAQGLSKGTRVSAAFPNAEGDKHLIAYFAVQKAGGTFVPINTRYTATEVEKQLAHSESRFLIIDDALYDRWQSGIDNNILTIKGSGLYDVIQDAPANDPDVAIEPQDTAEIMYTSGTTGRSKGVQVSHGSLLTLPEAPLVALFGGRRFLNTVPIHTFAGSTYMLQCVRCGMTNVLMAQFDPHRFVDLLETENIFSTYAVAPMWLLILKNVDDLAQRNFSHVFSITFGAAPMPPSAVLQLCDAFPKSQVLNIYGLTEAGTAGCMMPFGQARNHPNSVGMPLPTTEVMIVAENGTPQPTGEPGEIWMRLKQGPTRRYYKDDEATKQAWKEDGWLDTGDIGYLDDVGYVYLIDRKKDLIIRGGNNIASLEVEDALFQHAQVGEAAVVGVPHDVLGEDVVACVVKKSGSNIDGEQLRSFLLEKLADYKVPRRYEFLDELPKNPMGKILKRELKAQIGSAADA